MSVTRKWSLLAAVLVLAIVAAGWFLLISPKRGEAAALRADTVTQEEANQRLLQQLEVLKAQQADLPKFVSAYLKENGLTFEEAITVFADPLALLSQDALHPERSLIVGQSMTGRLLITVCVEVHEDEIRIISARRATRYERRMYEEGQED